MSEICAGISEFNNTLEFDPQERRGKGGGEGKGGWWQESSVELPTVSMLLASCSGPWHLLFHHLIPDGFAGLAEPLDPEGAAILDLNQVQTRRLFSRYMQRSPPARAGWPEACCRAGWAVCWWNEKYEKWGEKSAPSTA